LTRLLELRAVRFFPVLVVTLLVGCADRTAERDTAPRTTGVSGTSLVVLGTLQDGGSPHAGCAGECCRALFERPDPTRRVVALGLIDPANRKTYLIEATPDLPVQMKMLKHLSGFQPHEVPDGIFVTHAHIGHYSGLMFLGREAMNADAVPVFVMPRMKTFLENNGPWSQLVSLQNITLQPLHADSAVRLTSQLSMTPILVPHRDEFSETVGFVIEGQRKKVLFIPDIDKWGKWDRRIVDEIAQVDYALIDATFYDGAELGNRDMSEIPHPFVVESMELLRDLPASEKGKVHFIHLNHTNPLLIETSTPAKEVRKAGFRIARFGQVLPI
jgi:pyrroloquinoline quinone biosynthesis protein B